ncbi:MAG: alpha/beta hydrolase [Planctomycetota bacterium]
MLLARLLLASSFAAFAWNAVAGEPEVVRLWPGTPPGPAPFVAEGVEESGSTDGRSHGGKTVLRITDVTAPEMHIYRAPEQTATGAACVVCPGGGFSILAWDMGGTEVAERLNGLGVTAAVLKYRCPTRPKAKKNPTGMWRGPAIDAQRALSILRSRADELAVDPEMIGIGGSSAGGKTAAVAAIRAGERLYEPVDGADSASCRADFAWLLYPAYLTDETGTLKPEVRPTFGVDPPPVFFAHAADDPVTCGGSVSLFLALRSARAEPELHIYASGGHAFGLRPTPTRSERWGAEWESWLVAGGWGTAAAAD